MLDFLHMLSHGTLNHAHDLGLHVITPPPKTLMYKKDQAFCIAPTGTHTGPSTVISSCCQSHVAVCNTIDGRTDKRSRRLTEHTYVNTDIEIPHVMDGSRGTLQRHTSLTRIRLPNQIPYGARGTYACLGLMRRSSPTHQTTPQCPHTCFGQTAVLADTNK